MDGAVRPREGERASEGEGGSGGGSGSGSRQRRPPRCSITHPQHPPHSLPDRFSLVFCGRKGGRLSLRAAPVLLGPREGGHGVAGWARRATCSKGASRPRTPRARELELEDPRCRGQAPPGAAAALDYDPTRR